MDMSGERKIPAARQIVWDALNDPEVLRQCIPGCEEISGSAETGFDAKVGVKVGPVKAKFGGSVTLSDLDPPKSYKISGEGKGGAAGFAKGGAEVTLEEADGGAATLLRYAVNANVGGKLAQIGSRLIDGTAKKYATEFFETFTEIASARASSDTPTRSETTETSIEAPVADPAPEIATPTSNETTKTKETKPMANNPMQEEMDRLGIPAENVYTSIHWTVWLNIAAAVATTVLLFVGLGA